MSRGEDYGEDRREAGLVKAPPARPGAQTMPPPAAEWLSGWFGLVVQSELCFEEDAQSS